MIPVAAPLQHSAGLDFEDREGHLQLVNRLPNFRMLPDFGLQSFQQAVSSSDMFDCLSRIGVGFGFGLGWHETHLYFVF